MKKNTIVFCLILLVNTLSFAQDVCGTCSTPTCKIYGPVQGTSLTDASSKVNWSSIPPSFTYNVITSDPTDKVFGPKTFSNCYTITLSEVTSIGVKIKSVNKSAGVTFSAKLYPISETACLGGSYSPDRTLTVDGTGVPEWDDLAVGSYKMCITINLPASEFIGDMTVAYYTTSTTTPASNNECGTCAIPNCKITHNTTKTDATTISNSDYNIADYFVPSTAAVGKVSTCYTLTTDANGTLGVRISEDLQKPDPVNGIAGCSNTEADAIDLTRKYTLVEKDGTCPGVPVSPNVTNKANSLTKFNPEWYGLKSNTDYTLCVEVDINQNPTCKLIKLGMVYYHPTSSVPPVPTPLPCGTVGIAWRNSANTPSTSDLNICRDKNFEIKANSVIIATQDIAPGFLIDNDFGKINLTKIELDQDNTGNYINTLGVKDITFCSPKVDYIVRLTGTVLATGNGIIRIVDHATGQVLFSGPFVTGMVIPINSGMIKGTAVFSGPGVSNYRLNYPTTGSTVYEAAGYGFFNPKTAGNGKHKINYSWNNGNKDCGSAFIEVEVNGCACNPDNGTSVIKINNATPTPLKNPFPNTYILCYDDIFTINTTGATPSVDYALFTCAPTSNKIDNTTKDACYADAFFENLNSMSETSKGNTSAVISYLASQSKTVTKNTLWWAPVTTATISILSDEACYQMDYQNEAYKVTYLNEITIDTITECSNSRFKLKILGGSPEFVSGSTYSLSTNKGKFSSTTSTTATMTTSGGIDYLTGLVSGETFTITITDGVGCTKTVTGKYVCPCSKPTITLNATPTEVCLGATTTSFAYTATTNSPDKYSITWIGAAITDGFVDISDVNLSTSPISVNIPSAATAQTYSGSLTVKNSTTGCTSTPQNISFVINGKPTVTPTPNEVCFGLTTTSFAYSGITNSPNKYSITWNSTALADNFVNISDAALSTSPISVNIPTTAKALTYIGSITVKNSTTGCSSSAQNISFVINGNPTITIPTTIPIPATFILEGKDSILSVSGGSGTGGAIAWKSSSPANATVVGLGVANQTAKVSGVLLGNTDIIYTDSKGCDDTVNIAISIPGCNAITKITSDQTWCQGIDPNALEFSTNETATDGISFVVFPATLRPITGAAVYAGGVGIKKETPSLGKVSLDLPTLGSIVTGSLPVVIPGDYYVYGILNSTPSNAACRPYAEIKVTIKDTTSPSITIVNTGTLNEYKVTWKDVPDAVSYKVDTVTYVKGTVPASPNWKSLPANITANHTLQSPLIFPNIPYGRTLLVQVTPLDLNGVKLTCNPIREKSIDNPNCTKPDLLSLNIPDTVCEGVSLDLLKGKINTSSVKVNFEWYVSTDSLNWTLLSSGGDYLISNTTLNEASDLAIKTKRTMNKSFVRLVGKDVATGQCSDTTLPVKIMVNEIPDATISIFPDPAKLCVGDPKPIEVTFQGNKGVHPYRFDFKLDGALIDTTSASVPGDGKVTYTFNTNSIIEDSLFILEKVTDKNGCFKNIVNQSVKMEVIPLPQLDFQADKTIGCYPLEVIFTDISPMPVTNTDVVWDFGNGDLDYSSLGVVKYVFQKSGDYTINFKSTIDGCWDTIQKTNYIHVKDRPEAKFSPKKTNLSLIDPEIQFINSSSSNSIYYKWIFGDGSPVSNVENPKHIYIGDGSNGLPNPGKYTVELYAYINQDCWDSTSTIITIDDEQIYYIPNTFTPNGDEKNNTFQPIFTSGFDAQNYHFLIYNRWGELIFESNNPAIGWDGTYGNKLLMNDSYTWKLQFKEKMTEKEHYLTGHVNLLK